jgi:hypothetical protein
MHSICNYIPDTNHVSRAHDYNVNSYSEVTVYGTCNAISHDKRFVLLH